MIVRYTVDGWEIVTQRNHGMLAADICARWKLEDQPKRWVETLVACAGHDDAFNELDGGDLITESGGPKNFNMGEFSEESAQKQLDLAITKSSFAALLTLKHIEFIHGDSPAAKAYLQRQNKLEKDLLGFADSTPEEVENAYQLLEFCDAFSLLICQNILQPEARSQEISSGPDGTSYEVITMGDCLKVTPWPFEVNEFPISYEIRCLQQLSYKTSAAFEKTLRGTKPIRITLQVKKKL